MNEQFSAFLDGEATRDEADSVISTLLRDETLRASWSRQHWLRTTLRTHSSEAALALDTDFSNRVMQAIAQDDCPETVARLHPRATASGGNRSRRRRWRGMASLAAVASAAGIVLLVNNPFQPDSQANQVVASSASTASVRPQNVEPVAATTGTSNSSDGMVASASMAEPVAADSQGSSDHWSVSDPALENELNGYLIEHNGLARSYGLSGTTPALVQVAATYGQDVAR